MNKFSHMTREEKIERRNDLFEEIKKYEMDIIDKNVESNSDFLKEIWETYKENQNEIIMEIARICGKDNFKIYQQVVEQMRNMNDISLQCFIHIKNHYDVK